MAHHTHFSHPQILETGHTFELQSQCCGTACASPEAVVDRIGRWLWLNVVMSLCALAAILALTSQHWLVFILTLTTSILKSKSKTRILRSQKRLDRATALTVAGLIVAGLFYTCILLILSRRERYITEQASASTSSISPDGESVEAIDVLEDAADDNSRVTKRESVVFLMLVVCQNGLAALLLYVGIRVMFLLKSSSTALWGLPMYIELGYTTGQVVLMTFVIVHCTMQDDKLGEYLRARQAAQSPEKMLGWLDHEENS